MNTPATGIAACSEGAGYFCAYLDVPWSVCVVADAAELIEMLSQGQTRMDPKTKLDEGQDTPCKGHFMERNIPDTPWTTDASSLCTRRTQQGVAPRRCGLVLSLL